MHSIPIAITTIAREVTYINRLLQGIDSTCKLTLVVCGVDASYLHEYGLTPNIDVITATCEEWEHFLIEVCTIEQLGITGAHFP